MTVEWHGSKVLNAIEANLRGATKKIAENVMNDAKRILKQKATTTTEKGLLSQFDIQKSKYDKDTLLVYCQGPGNVHGKYHASFVELGTYKDEAKPYMRPARKKNLSKAKRLYKDALK